MMERIKKEEEMRKKKEQEDSLTLEQTKEQVKTVNKGNIHPLFIFPRLAPIISGGIQGFANFFLHSLNLNNDK